MTANKFSIKISDICKDYDLRGDEKYHKFLHFFDWNLFGLSENNLIPLGDILIEDTHNFSYQDGEDYKGIPTGQTYIDEDGEIRDFQIVNLDNHPDRLCYRATSNNILISSLRLAKSPALLFENEDLSDYVFSNGYYSFKVIKGWNKKFVLYILRTKKIKSVLDNHIYRGIGISSYKKDDLLKIKIPCVEESSQNRIVIKIEQIEDKIQGYKKQIKQPQEIIDSVFAKKFGFELNEFNKLTKKNEFKIPLTKFSNNIDLRNSVNFHRDSTYYVMNVLKKITSHKLKDFIDIPIELGASISPENFSQNGDYYYISMESVKRFVIELNESQLVSNNYARMNLKKSVRKFDIIMTRSGVAIGKFALIEEDIKGIFADFTMRIRLKNYNPYFAYYYFRTSFFQHLIHTNKKGLQNQNIFPNQIREFPLIELSSYEQQRIVDEIKNKLDDQELLRKEIILERTKIDGIIENSLMNS